MRTPCCEEMGLKKGPWTPEEDQILISYIGRYGHDNWRALPKQAGLHRCGKSCRLRWTNYLRPDIKRGNFSKEEEETIIKLHQVLGNRWSAIATRLPGRTDNEIKNFWHTHLKKKLKQNPANADTMGLYTGSSMCNINMRKSGPVNFSSPPIFQSLVYAPIATPKNSKSDNSSSDYPVIKTTRPPNEEDMNGTPHFPEMSSSMTSKFVGVSDPRLQFSCSTTKPRDDSSSNINDDMAFWYNLFIKAEDQTHCDPEK